MEFKSEYVNSELAGNDRRISVAHPRKKSIAPPPTQRRQSYKPAPVTEPRRKSIAPPAAIHRRRQSSVGSMFDDDDSFEDSVDSARSALSNIIMSRKCWHYYICIVH